jgi:hypothetical protein
LRLCHTDWNAFNRFKLLRVNNYLIDFAHVNVPFIKEIPEIVGAQILQQRYINNN